MRTKDLQYNLPPERIAQRPCQPRDAARLLVLHRATGIVQHRVVRDLPEFLNPDDCLVINRTHVLPAKFLARRQTGGQIGGLFVREESAGRWIVLLTGAGRLKEGERLALASSPWSMTLLQRGDRGSCEVRVDPPDPAHAVLNVIGAAPLPPYIRRSPDDPAELSALDRERYQTVYGDAPGAIAAPTAGLHFTSELLQKIRGSVGTSVASVVLHVGLGTFQPVEVQDLADHPMHSEWYSLAPDNAAIIQRARVAGGRVVAVGTTSVRVLETCGKTGELLPHAGWTDLLIYPPYTFRMTDGLLTNLHLPGSTLLALVCAFAGSPAIMDAYQVAIREGYRFYSYGDAMLIL
ncbi:MAG: tRNA preQ1(34) S-adenosylmethionine ribosyltransferase-isomerase QueA [Phycisphaerae bacterium]|nr:tRNA preQ1(34) S-adenosylmethionine ribosyltransferase-isomerase QueA [Phycisphaerae bacterium]